MMEFITHFLVGGIVGLGRVAGSPEIHETQMQHQGPIFSSKVLFFKKKKKGRERVCYFLKMEAR